MESIFNSVSIMESWHLCVYSLGNCPLVKVQFILEVGSTASNEVTRHTQ